MALDADLVDGGLRLVQDGTHLQEDILRLLPQVRAVAGKEYGVGELDVHLAAAHVHLDAILHIPLGGHGLEGQKDLIDRVVDLPLGGHIRDGGHPALFVVLRVGYRAVGAAGIGGVQLGKGVEAGDDGPPLILADGRHGVQQNEKTQK